MKVKENRAKESNDYETESRGNVPLLDVTVYKSVTVKKTRLLHFQMKM